MKLRFVTISLILALFSQQVMAGVVTASMMGSNSFESPTMSMDGMSHHDHQMTFTSDMGQDSESMVMDCCQSDCAYCIAGCYSLINSLLSNQPSIYSLQPILQSPPEALTQSLDSPFRPPILA